ncbi:MAG: hypothetical protein ABII97_01255 [Patescibacteria group bacterium]
MISQLDVKKAVEKITEEMDDMIGTGGSYSKLTQSNSETKKEKKGKIMIVGRATCRLRAKSGVWAELKKHILEFDSVGEAMGYLRGVFGKDWSDEDIKSRFFFVQEVE